MVRKEILDDLVQALAIVQQREKGDMEELQHLSNHAIDDVAVHKDLDLISITVLLYSIYKIINTMEQREYDAMLQLLQKAQQSLSHDSLGIYNKNIRALYDLVKSCNAKVKVHLQDVMEAAKIKKGSLLLQKGLSIGQAAGLMGLSNWELQQYAGHTTILSEHTESVPMAKRLTTTYKLFHL